MRIVQIVENLNRQASESWLLDVLEAGGAEWSGAEWTFFCIVGRPGVMDDRARRLGARVIHSPVSLSETLGFLRFLRATVREARPDVLHCHQDVTSGLFLLATLGLPIPVRIVHVHNTSLAVPVRGRLKPRLVRWFLKRLCYWRATKIVGVSRDALGAMVPRTKQTVARDRVVHCGIDTTRFHGGIDRAAKRAALGIPAEALVMLFVGRMVDEKNPLFALHVQARVHAREPRTFALFVGTGPLEAAILSAADALGLRNQVRVLGWRDDVPQLMQIADVLLWTGREEWKEGLGLGVVEAQAAGLPVAMSRNVPSEAIVDPSLVRQLGLAEGHERWADAVLQLVESGADDPAKAVVRVETSSFGICNSMRNVRALYNEMT